MASRENILNRVRAAVAGERQDNWQEELEKRNAHTSELIRPAPAGDLLSRFTEKLLKGGGTYEQIDTESQVPVAVLDYVKANQLQGKLRLSPKLIGIDWGEELQVSYGNTRGADLISVTPALCAVAETGSVVLISGQDSPTSLNFLPDVHIVIISESQLVAQYEDVWARVRILKEIPRTINFITGPSRTADIEQRIQIGAHGPRSLHVLITRT